VRRFEGEDRHFQERLKEQRKQMRGWIQRQTEEREAAERVRRDTEKACQEVILSRDERAITLARMEEECRRRLNEATAKFNRALVWDVFLFDRVRLIYVYIYIYIYIYIRDPTWNRSGREDEGFVPRKLFS